jgi:hypothetical protein
MMPFFSMLNQEHGDTAYKKNHFQVGFEVLMAVSMSYDQEDSGLQPFSGSF